MKKSLTLLGSCLLLGALLLPSAAPIRAAKTYTALCESLENGGIRVSVDGGTAYFLTPADAGDRPGPYRRLPAGMPEEAGADVLTALLCAGYPLNFGDLQQIHGLSDTDAYRLTQEALWALNAPADAASRPADAKEAAYVEALVTAGREQRPVESQLRFRPDSVRFTQEGESWRTGVIRSSALLSGTVDTSDLPEGIRACSPGGEPLTGPLPAGSALILMSDAPVEAGVLTLSYGYPDPVLYRYEPQAGDAGTLVRIGTHNSTRKTAVPLTVEAAQAAPPSSQNPGTGIRLPGAVAAFSLAGGCVLLLFVPGRRRRPGP